MKGILGFGILLLVAVAAVFLLSHPRVHYGPPFQGAKALPLAHLLESPADHLREPVRIKGTITRQCPECRCWFVVEEGGRELKVEAGDIGEPLPRRLGRRVTVEGRLIRYGDGYEFVGSAVEFD